jgi:3-oxoacyl-[acyl-carrier protein] reductase
MLNLENKVALITGASGGIGSACARLFHKLGAHVIISGTNMEKLETLAKELENNYTIKPCDLKNQQDCINLIEQTEHLDVLICNAGITKDTLAMRMPIESFEEVIDVNLTASFILNQGAIKKMIKARYGRIINISSVVAITGNPGQVNYCASKAGLIGMSKSLALEVATRGVTVDTIAPGCMVSELSDAVTGSFD